MALTPYLAVTRWLCNVLATYNEIHKCVGGEVYTALLTKLMAQLPYPKLRNQLPCLNSALHITG